MLRNKLINKSRKPLNQVLREFVFWKPWILLQNADLAQLVVEIWRCRHNQYLVDVGTGPGYNGNNKTDNTEKG